MIQPPNASHLKADLQEIQFLLRRNLITRIPKPNPILPIQPLLSFPPKFVFPIEIQSLPEFLGKIPKREETQPISKHLQKESITKQKKTLSQKYSSLTAVYDKFQGVFQQGSSEPTAKGFNQLHFDCSSSSARGQWQLKGGERAGDCGGVIFQSRFQSGNLSKAYQIQANQYDLILQYDINTTGYTQWFFFRVHNRSTLGTLKFSIVNMYKSSSLFKEGMKIVVFSKRLSEKSGVSWHRGGQNIGYRKNELVRQQGSLRHWNTLSWEYEFQYAEDQVYFSYSYPYTYSQLNSYLDSLEALYLSKRILRRDHLLTTLAGNRLDVLTITSPGLQKNKPLMIFTARIHPGQTVSSFVAKGIIDFLLSQNKAAIQLRKKVVFKIVPMLNPDGVIHGNYRCNLSGRDLNRQWLRPNAHLHGQVSAVKSLVMKQRERVVLFIDLHGHSNRKNIFVYGCDYQGFNARALPFLISKLFSQFSFEYCTFQNNPDREGSARMVLASQLDVPNVFTLESSFCGPQHDNIHFSIEVLQEMGKQLCKAIAIYFQFYSPTSESPKAYLRCALQELSCIKFHEIQPKESDSEDEELTLTFNRKNVCRSLRFNPAIKSSRPDFSSKCQQSSIQPYLVRSKANNNKFKIIQLPRLEHKSTPSGVGEQVSFDRYFLQIKRPQAVPSRCFVFNLNKGQNQEKGLQGKKAVPKAKPVKQQLKNHRLFQF